MKLLDTLKSRWIVWVWNHTPNCAEMSRLASRSFDRPPPPSLKLRLRMWLHYLICVWCERYYRHLKFLHRAAPRLSEQLESAQALSAEAKQRMVQRLQAAHDR